MKNQVFFIFFFLISLVSCGEKPAGNDKSDILKVLEDQRQAWNKGDLEGYMQGYVQSDSLVFIGKNGPRYGWKTTFENYKRGYPDKAAMGYLTFDIRDVRIIGTDYAFVVGGWHLNRVEDEPQGSFTLLMKKIDGKWKVIADHSS